MPRNAFAVGSVGTRISIVDELPEKLSKAEALNLAAHLVACALTLKGSDPDKELTSFFELVAEVCEDEAVASKIREGLR